MREKVAEGGERGNGHILGGKLNLDKWVLNGDKCQLKKKKKKKNLLRYT